VRDGASDGTKTVFDRKIQEEAASLGDFLETSWEIKFSRRLFG